MSYRAVKHKFTGNTTPITSYDATKTNLGTLMAQQTGTAVTDKYVGPLPVGVATPMQEVVSVAGTVSVSTTAVTGTSTAFTSSMVGMLIGFGSTNPAKITTWYTISAYTSATSITLSSSAGTIGSSTAYVVVANIPVMYPHAITYSSTIDWVFAIENLATATTARRIVLYEYNKATSVYTWKGFINSTLLSSANANTIRGFRALRYLHTGGTVTINSTTVSGTGTTWKTEGAAVGARIGFGSTDPAQTTTWYNTSALATDTSLTLSTSINLDDPLISINQYFLSGIASSSDGIKLVMIEKDNQIYTSTDSGTNWVTRDSSRNWQSITSSSDGTKLAACVNGGYIYTSTDSGATWSTNSNSSGSRSWLGVASSSDGTKLAACVYGGYIYTSTDSGATWSTNSNSSGSADWIGITSSSDGTKLAACVYGGYIYTSTDSGVTWSTNSNSSGSRSWLGVASSSDGTKLVACVVNGYIYTSTDSGVTWSTNSNSSGSRSWLGVASSSDGTKLAACVVNGYIYTSTDSGVTWSTNSNSSGSRSWLGVASSSDGTKLAACVYGRNTYTTSDSGTTWTARDSNRNWQSITSSSDGTKLAACVYGGYIYTSTDSGALGGSLTARDSVRNWRTISSSSDGTKLVANGGSDYIYTSTDSGVTWSTNSNSSGSADWYGVTSSSDGTKLAACAGGGYIYTSTDSGVTWSTNSNSSGSRSWRAISSSSDGTKLAACDNGGYIYTSTDSGVTWSTNSNSSGSRQWYRIASSSDGTKLAACDFQSYIYTSTDSGVTWSTNSNSSGSRSWRAISSSSDGTKLVACASSNYILTSTDSGVTWSTNSNSSGTGNWYGVTSSSDGTKLAAVRNNGYIYTSTDSGVTWQTNTTSPIQIYTSSTPYVIEELRFAITTTQATTPTNGGLFLVKGVNYSDFVPTGTTIAAATSTDDQKAVYWLADAGTSGNVVTNVAACGLAVAPEVNKGLHYAYVLDGFGSTYARVFRYNLRATGAIASGKMTMSVAYYTAGTVAVSGTAVTGSSTTFTAAMVGMKIGFNTKSPANVTTWYTIDSYTSATSITLSSSAGTIGAGAVYIIDSADVVSTAPQLLTGTLSGVNNGRYGTLSHGPGSGEASLYFVTTTRIYRAAISKIFAGNLGWISDNKPEIPTGTASTFPATSLLSSCEIVDSIDRLIVVSTGASGARNYVTKYPQNAGDAFDHIWGVDDKQQDQVLALGSAYITSGTVAVSTVTVTGTNTFFTSAMVGFRIGFGSTDPTAISTWYTISAYTSITSITLSSSAGTIGGGSAYVIDWNSGTVPHFSTGSQAMSMWSENGITHVTQNGVVPSQSQMYALPLSAHWTYASSTNQRVITPAIYTPDCVQYRNVIAVHDDSLGSGEFALTTEPYRMYFRISGIDDNTGEWTLVDADGDLRGLTGSTRIQFMFEFATIGTFCVPARIMSLTVVYDDALTSTDSHYQPSAGLSSGTTKKFVWRFATAFGGTVPTLRVRLYNAVTNELLTDDYTVGSIGTWEKSTNSGAAWAAYNTTDKANETTYIRYTPDSLGNNVKVRAVLTQN